LNGLSVTNGDDQSLRRTNLLPDAPPIHFSSSFLSQCEEEFRKGNSVGQSDGNAHVSPGRELQSRNNLII
jgi:hypothetical protein